MLAIFPQRSLAIALAGAALALSACKKAEPPGAEEPFIAATSEPEAPPPPAAEPAALDYLKLALPHLAATYEGQCLTLPDNAPAQGPILLAANGTLTRGRAAADFAKANFMLARAVDNSIRAGYTASLSRGEQAFMLQPLSAQDGQDGHAGGLSATIRNGEEAVSCSVPAKALPLAGRTLYSVFASVLDTPARNVGCVTAKGNASLEFALARGIFTLGDYTVDLNKVNNEMAAVVDDSNQFAYMAKPGHDQELGVTLDRTGRLSTVTLQAPGVVASCAGLDK